MSDHREPQTTPVPCTVDELDALRQENRELRAALTTLRGLAILLVAIAPDDQSSEERAAAAAAIIDGTTEGQRYFPRREAEEASTT